LNDENAVSNATYYLNRQSKEVELRYVEKERKPRELLVEILVFTLMPNHFHLLLRQKKEKGIVKFMQKLGTGYTNYFNKKYERVGGLFQGSFKAVLVSEEPHFIHLPYYIHTNPLSLLDNSNYGSSTSIVEKEMEFLENYRWSSFPDYIGKKNYPSVTSRGFLSEFLGGPEEYRKATLEWLKGKEADFKDLEGMTLE